MITELKQKDIIILRQPVFAVTAAD